MSEVAALAPQAISSAPWSEMVIDSRISAAESAFAAIWVTVRGRRVALSCLGQSPLIDNGVAAASSKIVLYLGTKPIVIFATRWYYLGSNILQAKMLRKTPALPSGAVYLPPY